MESLSKKTPRKKGGAMKPYATNLAIKSAGYKSIAQFCRAHGIKESNIRQHNWRFRDRDFVMPKVQSILDLEASQNEVKFFKDIIKTIELIQKS